MRVEACCFEQGQGDEPVVSPESIVAPTPVNELSAYAEAVARDFGTPLIVFRMRETIW
jgi:hypothetical protein